MNDPIFARREFLQTIGAAAGGAAAIGAMPGMSPEPPSPQRAAASAVPVTLTVNGTEHRLDLDPRASLLDTLRERLHLSGTKKGCDRGECGACTVHVDGRRILSCMTLAIMQQRRAITTIEGLGQGGELHPVQRAFIEHDAFQCGFCTSGQIMSAVACIREGHAESAEEIREWMSGNLCRCSAYPNIVAAVQAAGPARAGA
ncbi:MAG: (2Fe-2S)-binding protein [Gemmatimonadales bacterium]|nr:(2Fe-2S)-binding protein [Gemmatimonadales bacterium]MBA3554674.1 (2Fe-2S)-binding protein [Gemmatimonadales bacterium]